MVQEKDTDFLKFQAMGNLRKLIKIIKLIKIYLVDYLITD